MTLIPFLLRLIGLCCDVLMIPCAGSLVTMQCSITCLWWLMIDQYCQVNIGSHTNTNSHQRVQRTRNDDTLGTQRLIWYRKQVFISKFSIQRSDTLSELISAAASRQVVISGKVGKDELRKVLQSSLHGLSIWRSCGVMFQDKCVLVWC